jgi:integrase
VSTAVQLALFDTGVDYAALRRTQERIMTASRAANTVAAYRFGWKTFEQWCEQAGRPALPADPETVRYFVTALIELGRRLATIHIKLASIREKHVAAGLPSPVDASVRLLLQNAARELKERPQGKASLTVPQLRAMCRRLSHHAPRDLRDRAIILCGVRSGWRGSELASLQYPRDVSFERLGMTLKLGASKTDQQGRGRNADLKYGKLPLSCPVRALKAWLRIRGDWPGPLFVRVTPMGDCITKRGIKRAWINRRLKHAIASIGVDPSVYGSHSMRATHVTLSADRGATIPQIMARTGHKSPQTLMRYMRPPEGALFRSDTMAAVL